MMVNIERGALEDIVKDGVKEMMSQIGDRNSKRRVWVLAAKNAVKEYQQKVNEKFLPVLDRAGFQQQTCYPVQKGQDV